MIILGKGDFCARCGSPLKDADLTNIGDREHE